MIKQKKKIILIFLAVMMVLSLTACGSGNTDTDKGDNGKSNPAPITSAKQKSESDEKTLKAIADKYADATIGVQTGSVFDQIVNQYIPGATVDYYNSSADLALALKKGKIDAYVADEPMARLLCQNYPDEYITAVFEECPYAYVYPKGKEKTKVLQSQMNEFLKKIKSDGTMDEIDEIWFGKDENRKVVDISNLDGKNGTLEFAMISAVGAPFVYVKDNSYVGYDVDIAARFCKEYGYTMNITDYNISGFFSAVSSGLADFGASSVCVTEERKEEMDFSDPNYEGSVVLVARDRKEAGAGQVSDDKNAVKNPNIIESLINSFNKTFIRENRWMMFARGLGVTVLMTVMSVIFGSLLGFVLFLLYRKNKRKTNKVIDAISAFLRMTPVVVILMIFYYLIFAKSGISGVAVAIFAFSIMFACSVIDLFKASVNAVDPGQTDAVRALGYRDTKGFIRMILPQAIPHFIAGYRGEIIGLIKNTAIVGYVAVQDLTMVTDIIRARTYDAFFPLIITAIIYFLFALLLIKLINRVELKIDPRNRKESTILKGVDRK